jgi:hypothetical protein
MTPAPRKNGEGDKNETLVRDRHKASNLYTMRVALQIYRALYSLEIRFFFLTILSHSFVFYLTATRRDLMFIVAIYG